MQQLEIADLKQAVKLLTARLDTLNANAKSLADDVGQSVAALRTEIAVLRDDNKATIDRLSTNVEALAERASLTDLGQDVIAILRADVARLASRLPPVGDATPPDRPAE